MIEENESQNNKQRNTSEKLQDIPVTSEEEEAFKILEQELLKKKGE